MRGKQRKLRRCVQGDHTAHSTGCQGTSTGYLNSAWGLASGLGQLGAVDVRIDRQFNQFSKKTHGRGEKPSSWSVALLKTRLGTSRMGSDVKF
jgi:hypothetical protein